MITLGYKLSSEEQSATDLVRYAQMAQDTGLRLRPHLRPLPPVDRPAGSEPLRVECAGRHRPGHAAPHRRHGGHLPEHADPSGDHRAGRRHDRHAHARTILPGLGTGENLNEHVVGQGWPETEVRQARLEEAIEIIRLLWKGGNQSYHGRYFTVENARLYSLTRFPAAAYVAVGGPRSADLAGRVADGMIGTEPDASLLARSIARAAPASRAMPS